METYRKTNQWSSHSWNMIESIRRFYNNSFLDAQRQEAINLFLGNYIYLQGQPLLWDLASDYFLHHVHPQSGPVLRRNYIHWWTPENLKAWSGFIHPSGFYEDDFWQEYYRPRVLTSLKKVFAFGMNSTLRYIPLKPHQNGRFDLSPFSVRANQFDDDPEGTPPEKGKAKLSLHRWLPNKGQYKRRPSGFEAATDVERRVDNDIQRKKVDVSSQNEMGAIVSSLLDRPLSVHEKQEYERYITHFSKSRSTAEAQQSTTEYIVDVDQVISRPTREEDLAIYRQVAGDGKKLVNLFDEKDASQKKYAAYTSFVQGRGFRVPATVQSQVQVKWSGRYEKWT